MICKHCGEPLTKSEIHEYWEEAGLSLQPERICNECFDMYNQSIVTADYNLPITKERLKTNE